MTNTNPASPISALEKLFKPNAVCIVGASPDEKSIPGMALDRLLRHGFNGNIHLVNPKYAEVSGRRCYPSIKELPERVDTAMVCVPGAAVPEVLDQCGAAGVAAAVVVAAGFEEIEGGSDLTSEFQSAIARSGVRVVGPNTEGVWNVPGKVMLTFGSASAREKFIEGPVSVISQSGGIGTACVRQLQDRGIGCGYFIGVGNETDLTALDFLEYIVREGKSPVVLVYTEGLRDGWRLRNITREAHARGVRIVVLRAGTSEAGRRATATHTGRVASASRVYASILRQFGIVEVQTPSELWQAGLAFAVAGEPPTLQGPTGVGVMSISGGCRGVIADSCDRRGVPLSVFAPQTEQALAGIVTKVGVTKNPVDPSASVMTVPGLFDRAVETVACDPHSEIVLVQYGNGALRMMKEHLDFFTRLRREVDKPVILCSLGDELDPGMSKRLHDMGVLWASDPDRAAQQCEWLYRARDARAAGELLIKSGSSS